jgi:PAS domain-containing protein
MYRDPDFEVLLHALPEPVVVLTPDLIVRHVNAAFLATTGVSERDMLDRHLIDEVLPDKPGAAAPGRLMLRSSFQVVRRTGYRCGRGQSL